MPTAAPTWATSWPEQRVCEIQEERPDQRGLESQMIEGDLGGGGPCGNPEPALSWRGPGRGVSAIWPCQE